MVQTLSGRQSSSTTLPSAIPPMSTADDMINRQARLLKAIADPTRMRIVKILSQHEGDVCVYELVEQFQLSQPTISHHLRILRDAQVIDLRKKGLYAYYYLRRTTLQQAQQAMASLFFTASQQVK